MAFIQKLQIRGIRSFSPDRDENIEFYSPLTIILGKNGCGKTTIIEALKYCCTGALPPGTRSGQAFINDPSMTETSEVKSHIKLRFKNRRGFVCVATRFLQLSRKRTKLEFKALDSALKTVNEMGEDVSISMKCSELDRQIPDLIGVSAAVLESVIFCHQEESDWPMQDGAEVKKKFDDIFDSTRYSKALEAIMKAKKEKILTAKDLKAEAAELGAHLTTVKQLQKEYDICLENQLSCKNQLSAIDEQMDRFKDRLQVCNAYLSKYQTITDKVKTLQIRISETERRVKEKSTSIEKLLTVSDYELNHMIHNFDIDMKEKEVEKHELEKLIEQSNEEIKKLRIQQEDLGRQEGKAIAAKNQLEETKANALLFLNKMTGKFGIPKIYSHSWTPILSHDMIQNLETKCNQIHEEMEDDIQRSLRNVEEYEKKLTEERGQQRAQELEMESLHKELHRLSEKRNVKRVEQSSLGFSKNDFQISLDELEDAQVKCNNFETTMTIRLNELKRLQKEKSDEIRSLEEEIEVKDQLLQTLTIYRNENISIQMEERRLNEDLEAIQSDIRSLFESYQHREILTPFLSSLEKMTSRNNSVDMTTTSSVIIVSTLPIISLTILNDMIEELKRKEIQAIQEYNTISERVNLLSQDFSKQDGLFTQERNSLKAYKARESTIVASEGEFTKLINQINRLQSSYSHSFLDDSKYRIELDHRSSISDALDRIKCMSNDIKECIILMNAKSILKTKFDKKRRDLGSDRCPCCHQNMAPDIVKIYESSVQELLIPSSKSSLDSTGVHTSSQLEEVMKIENTCQDIYDSLMTLSSDLTELQLIRADIINSQKKMDEFSMLVNTLSMDLSEVKERQPSSYNRKQSIEICIKELKSIYQRVESYEKRRVEVEAKKVQARQHTVMVTSGSYSNSSKGLDNQLKEGNIEDLEVYCRERRNYKDTLVQLKEKFRNEEDNLLRQHQVFKNLLSDREKSYNTMKVKSDQHHHIETNLKELNQQYEIIDQSLQQISSSVSSSSSSSSLLASYSNASFTSNTSSSKTRMEVIRELESILQKNKLELKTLQDQQQQRVVDVRNDISQIQSSLKTIDNLECKYTTEYAKYSLESITNQRNDINSKIIRYEDQIKTQYQPKIQLILNTLSSQEQFKRNVQDNMILRSSQQELETMRYQLNELERELFMGFSSSSSSFSAAAAGLVYDGETSASKYRDTQREVQRIEQEKSKYQSEKDMLRGKLETYNEQFLNTETKLGSSTYKGIEVRHRRKTIEFETTEMAVKDLDSYYTALDSALQNFHIQKIKEINKIIRELWQLVYKGQDIDMIEVESGPETSTGLAVAARSGSRSYNYRVVMRKGDIPLDMRGRCSTGQRILASIVIRLALAETFCLNCGILALDEPTTNLDDANKAGLAYGLARIIQSRSKQQNFQLICITHDEDFVRVLNDELSAYMDFRKPDYFFKISREEEGSTGRFFSKIGRIAWEDM